MSWPRRFVLALLLLLALLVGAAWLAGEMLSRPAPAQIGAASLDLRAETISAPFGATGQVSGWLARGRAGGGAVLLLHGVRANRLQMAARARFLRAAGYSVLLIDLPAHGESSGDHITYGLQESAGVKAALTFLRRALPGERVGVIGVSLGAASLVFARPEPAPDAVVLESMFPTLREAVSNRMALRVGPQLGQLLTPLLLAQAPLRLGVSEDELRPIALISALHAPLLIAAGSEDRQTPIEAARRIFAAAAEPKTFWEVQGAAHVDLHAFAPAAYEQRVLAFLAQHLRGGPRNNKTD